MSTEKDTTLKTTKESTTAPSVSPPARAQQIAQQLRTQITRQGKLEDELNALEHAIFARESVYLALTGSVVRGFNEEKDREKDRDKDKDNRIFSLSSATYVHQIKNKSNDNNGNSVSDN